MRYIKIFEDFNQSFKIGDMVYVDSDPILEFNKDTKYQIVYIEGNSAFLYDESNYLVAISLKNLYHECIDFELVKDYFISSFEEFFYSDIIDIKYIYKAGSVSIRLDLKPDRRKIWVVRHKILYILNTEFKKRLESEGYYTEMDLVNYPEHRYENIISLLIKRKESTL